MTGQKLVEHALNSIIGIDVHPLAILVATANLLLALRNELETFGHDARHHSPRQSSPARRRQAQSNQRTLEAFDRQRQILCTRKKATSQQYPEML